MAQSATNLKKSIVLVNEYTIKNAKGGSRGGTPGDYVLRYMSRGGATEGVYPLVREDVDTYVTRYMARKKAVDNAIEIHDDGTYREGLKKEFRKLQGQGGVAFGYGEASLSHKKLKRAAKDIQKNFESGKTVLKTVLSFTEDYLRQNKIIDEGFEWESLGDYRGNIDQMKLRLAIMYGMQTLSRHYDDMQYIGVIQVDTAHVHCHLAIVDRGRGTVMPDGTQRGKLTSKEKIDLRRGIDMYLDMYQNVKMFASAYQHDKQNTISFIRMYTDKAIENRGFTQLVLACLPADRGLWRAGSNARSMQKANALVREYVESLMQEPDSGFESAINKSIAYADERKKREGLSDAEYAQLLRNGEERIIEAGMNSVYRIFKNIPEESLTTSTPWLTSSSVPTNDLAKYLGEELQLDNEDDEQMQSVMKFAYRLRTSSSRLEYHKRQFKEFHDAAVAYEKSETKSEESAPLKYYFDLETRYNEMLMSKYQHLLSIFPQEEEYLPELDRLLDVKRKAYDLTNALDDDSFAKRSDDNAIVYAMRRYGIEDGNLINSSREVMVQRLDRYNADYEELVEGYKVTLSTYGLRLDETVLDDLLIPYDRDFAFTESDLTEDDINNGITVEEKERIAYLDSVKLFAANKSAVIVSDEDLYDFDDTKALDIHHMLYDFPYDLRVSVANADAFVTMADQRYSAFQAARAYLIASGQTSVLENLPGNDIEFQHRVANRFRASEPQIIDNVEVKELQTQRTPTNERIKPVRTVSLSYPEYEHQDEDIKNEVQNELNDLQFNE